MYKRQIYDFQILSANNTKTMSFRETQPVRTKIVIDGKIMEQIQDFNYSGCYVTFLFCIPWERDIIFCWRMIIFCWRMPILDWINLLYTAWKHKIHCYLNISFIILRIASSLIKHSTNRQSKREKTNKIVKTFVSVFVTSFFCIKVNVHIIWIKQFSKHILLLSHY